MWKAGSRGRALVSLVRRPSPVAPRPLLLPCQAANGHRVAPRPNYKKEKRLDNWDSLQTKWPIAEALGATKLWNPRKLKGRNVPKGDRFRVNIVSDDLVRDILSYIGPTLDRHRGCDLLDLYPGAGLWSTVLHDYLQPRSHILMEPDAEFYRPFLQPLLDRPGVSLVPRDGIIWKNLHEVLSPDHLPNQTPLARDQPYSQNDTLLVTANLATQPKRRWGNFDSVATLVLHQFVDAIRTRQLFQRYGRVRMLVWIRNDDHGAFLPKLVARHKRQSTMNELLCDHVIEVCGSDAVMTTNFARDGFIDDASAYDTAKRMQAANMALPPGRIPQAFQHIWAAAKNDHPRPPAGDVPSRIERPFHQELDDKTSARAAAMEAAEHGEAAPLDEAADLAEQHELNALKWRANGLNRKYESFMRLRKSMLEIVACTNDGKTSETDIARLKKAWGEQYDALTISAKRDWILYRDELHVFQQDPPALHYDRRPYERLQTQPTEFFPNVPLSLMDIQPTDTHPTVRETGAKSNRGGDWLELLMTSMTCHQKAPLDECVRNLWVGAGDYIVPRWTSVYDNKSGIIKDLPNAGGSTRALNRRQWEQLLELWLEWPFHPELHEFIGRMYHDEDEESDVYDTHAERSEEF
ncbi:S-adenosyl-L-methionine-dependent methyltransferase [Xylariaceae sp. FL1272]|nr:S-adenosyl-L-methionine-dependent methyltransferase [Xylariaceae sp. FL1272]